MPGKREPPKLTLARMLGNVGVDFVVGAIPLLGDMFDVVWKANRKNARLLEQHLHGQRARSGGSRNSASRLTRFICITWRFVRFPQH